MSSRSQHLEAREKCLSSFPQNRKEEPYIHPLSKPSLTSISLDMCTEALCTESGAVISPFPDLGPASQARPRKQKAKRDSGGGKIVFPPPLASGMRVHSHREGGRLVIRASTLRLKVERGDGRLRMSLVGGGGGGGCEEGSVKEEGGKVLSVRCNGDRSGNERMHTFQFCVVGS